MTYAINIRAQSKSAPKIYDLWDKVSEFEVNPSMKGLKYPPHFTFGLFDTIDKQILKNATAALAENHRAQKIQFQSICYFDVSPMVLWLKAKDEQPLFEMHNSIFNNLPETLCRPHYKPEVWQPHCTLGFEVEDAFRDKAIALTKQTMTPFEVVFDIVDCVAFPPVKVLDELPLNRTCNS